MKKARQVILIGIMAIFFAVCIEGMIISWRLQDMSELYLFLGGIVTLAAGFFVWWAKADKIKTFDDNVRDKLDNI